MNPVDINSIEVLWYFLRWYWVDFEKKKKKKRVVSSVPSDGLVLICVEILVDTLVDIDIHVQLVYM